MNDIFVIYANAINLHILMSCICFGASNSTETSTNISQFNQNNTDFTAFIESYYSITCCRNGKPVPDDSISKFVRNFESQFAGHVLTDPLGNVSCDRYNGKYSIPLRMPITDDLVDPEQQQQRQNRNRLDFVNSVVKCKCPDDDHAKNLDRNCRQPMADCQNGGYRAFSINLRCVCPGQYFGDLCEKYCSNGQLEKNANQIFDHCSCRPNFYGEQCEKVVCFNGGTPVNGRGCSCPPFIFGQHCETFMNGRPIDASFKEWINADGQFVPPQFHVDPSKKQIWDATGAGATIFLLILIVAFSVYYCTVKRRRRNSTQVTTAVTHTSRVNELTENDITVGQIEMLAPLPTYEEAIKTTTILNVPQLARPPNQGQPNNSQQNFRPV